MADIYQRKEVVKIFSEKYQQILDDCSDGRFYWVYNYQDLLGIPNKIQTNFSDY